jgi:hypothetical protein
MSNELAVLMQNNPSLVQTGLDEDTMAVAGSGAKGNKRISIKGGVFRLIANGKEISAIEDRHMNVVIVKMAHNPSRMLYTETFKEGVKIAPACWSEDSKTPHPDVKNPMAKSCNSCPHSIKGSGNGGKGTACKLSWRTAVVLPNNPAGEVLQVVFPAASCWGEEDNGRWPFKPYVNMLANNNISANRVITKIQFDTKATAPKLLFSPSGAVPTEDIPTIVQQGKSKAAEDAVKLTVYQTDEESEAASPETSGEFPKVQGGDKAAQTPVDVSDTVKKWAKKK